MRDLEEKERGDRKRRMSGLERQRGGWREKDEGLKRKE
jgi:hypothetical protein